MPPRVAGPILVADGVVGVAETGERVGFVVTVSQIPKQLNRALVAGNCLPMVAKVVMSVRDAVPGGGLAGEVIQLLVEPKPESVGEAGR